MSMADAYEEQHEMNFKRFLEGVEGICEVTTFEKSALWREYTKEHGYSWESNNSGMGRLLGYIGKPKKGRCVHFTFWTAQIRGKKILFAEPTSRWVDWKMLREFCNERLPNVPSTNAENFGSLF